MFGSVGFYGPPFGSVGSHGSRSSHSLLRSLYLLVALIATLAHAVHPVVVRGQDFVDTVTNKRLMIIGVDYQPGGQASYKPSEGKDVLSDADVCLRDAALMQRLGVGGTLLIGSWC
jgi:hypothetical protein